MYVIRVIKDMIKISDPHRNHVYYVKNENKSKKANDVDL